MKRALPYFIIAFALTYADSSQARSYTIKKGDNLEKIADKFERSIDDLLVCNPNITNPNYLKQNQTLKLSASYTVKKGDSLSRIAKVHGTTISELLNYNKNKIADADEIFPGIILELPCRKAYSKPNTSDYDKEIPNRQKKKSKKTSNAKTLRFPSGLKLKIVSGKELTGFGKEFYDPNHTNTPLVKVPRNYLTKKVSEHFRLAEFAAIPTPSLINPKYKQRFAGDD